VALSVVLQTDFKIFSKIYLCLQAGMTIFKAAKSFVWIDIVMEM